jgi:hypothetical protein
MNVLQVPQLNSLELKKPAGRFARLKFTDFGEGQKYINIYMLIE